MRFGLCNGSVRVVFDLEVDDGPAVGVLQRSKERNELIKVAGDQRQIGWIRRSQRYVATVIDEPVWQPAEVLETISTKSEVSNSVISPSLRLCTALYVV